MSMSELAIEVKNLNQTLLDREILKNISFEVKKGRSLAVLGGSGAGKSVLLQVITGLIEKTEGKILILGKKHNSTEEQKKDFNKIGIMFQSCGLFNFLNVIENVACIENLIYFKKNLQSVNQKAEEMLFKVGLDESSFKKPISKISGGMQKRVAFARMLFYNPEIFFLDEPTAGLDPISSDEIAKVLKNILKEENKTCITITHDIHVANEIADDILFLYKGEILFFGKKDDFINSENQVVQRYIECCKIK